MARGIYRKDRAQRVPHREKPRTNSLGSMLEVQYIEIVLKLGLSPGGYI